MPSKHFRHINQAGVDPETSSPLTSFYSAKVVVHSTGGEKPSSAICSYEHRGTIMTLGDMHTDAIVAQTYGDHHLLSDWI